MSEDSPHADWFRQLVELSPEAAYVVADGRAVYANAATVRLLGAPSAAAVTGTDVLQWLHAEDHALALRRRREVLEHGKTAPPVEMRFVRADGRVVDVEVQAIRVSYAGRPATYAIARDIGARKRLEAHVHAAQRLDAVGRLAGGIAHDFNNTLAIILGHTEFALAELPEGHALRDDLEAVQRAAQHSASLTRQLLSYARRQTIQPRRLDLNAAVNETLRMLRPLLGEGIDLQWLPADALWPVLMDPAQLDQILTNLAVNARDAMDDMGTLTVATANRSLDDTAARAIPDAVAGDYVVLTVSDSGRGMTADVAARAFEPFFTTKAPGRGTGLGLSTVYGLVKQHHGMVVLRSAPGLGTRLELYFPRQGEHDTAATVPSQASRLRGGSETILVVEDEADILHLTARALRAQGYTVHEALGPTAAVRLLAELERAPALMLTDVMMPGMSGPDLAACVAVTHPTMRVLYMSGFSAELIAKHGRLGADVEFIGKPFTLRALADRVRDVLDRPIPVRP